MALGLKASRLTTQQQPLLKEKESSIIYNIYIIYI